MRPSAPPPLWLPDKDSNLDKKSQNLLCYRYTIGQNTVLILQKIEKMSRATSIPGNRFFSGIRKKVGDHPDATAQRKHRTFEVYLP